MVRCMNCNKHIEGILYQLDEHDEFSFCSQECMESWSIEQRCG